MKFEKLKSRKFQVWIVWSIFFGYSLFKGSVSAEITLWFGMISTAYMGTNVIDKYFDKPKV